MNIFNTMLKILVSAITVLLISACALEPARMAIPKDFAAKAEVMPTKGRSWLFTSTPFTFGEFQVREVETSSDFFDQFYYNLFPSVKLKLIDKDAQFKFVLDPDKSVVWQSQCHYNKKGQAISVNDGDIGTRISRMKRSLYCEIERSENSEVWELNIANTYDFGSPLMGDVTISNTKYFIRANDRIAESGQFLGSVYGFNLYANDELVGAVSILDDGIVWVDKSVAPAMREQLAVISSALLLYGRLESFSS